MVMGGDLYSIGRGFESQHWILDGRFLHYSVVKIVMFVGCRTKPKNNHNKFEKEKMYKKRP